jgi:hypothetical protein
MNYHILRLKVEKNKNKNKICIWKRITILEVGIGKNRFGILGVKHYLPFTNFLISYKSHNKHLSINAIHDTAILKLGELYTNLNQQIMSLPSFIRYK